MYFYGISGCNKIGGSSYFICSGNKKIILDMGIDSKEEGGYPEYESLYRKKLISSMNDLDLVAISHAHLDHIGSLPYIVKEGMKVPVLTSIESKILGEELLLSAHKEENIYIDRIQRDEIHRAFNQIIPNDSFEKEGLKVSLYDSGHILGAKMIEIETKDERILYTGDFSLKNMITTKKVQLSKLKSPDILICEGTNLNKNLDNYISERVGFIRHANKIISKGVLLIPAFALGRSQEILCLLKNAMKSQLLKKVPIYVDGLSVEISELYENLGVDVIGKDIKIVTNDFYKKMDNTPKIIVCSSGMLLEKSKSYKYAQKLLGDKNNGITFVGYQDKKTPGFKLLYDNLLEYKAKINRFNFSAHADEKEIFYLIERLKPKKVVFVHRNLKESEEKEIESKLKKVYGKAIKFYFPKDKEELNL